MQSVRHMLSGSHELSVCDKSYYLLLPVYHLTCTVYTMHGRSQLLDSSLSRSTDQQVCHALRLCSDQVRHGLCVQSSLEHLTRRLYFCASDALRQNNTHELAVCCLTATVCGCVACSDALCQEPTHKLAVCCVTEALCGCVAGDWTEEQHQR